MKTFSARQLIRTRALFTALCVSCQAITSVERIWHHTKPVYNYDESTGTYSGRAKGVVGAPIAWKYVVENNGKYSCHIHGGLWGAVTDRLLSKAADNAALFQKVADALDSQCCASLPFEIHVVHAAEKVLKVRSSRAALCEPPRQLDPGAVRP